MAATASKKKQTAGKPGKLGRPAKDSRQHTEVQESFIRAEVLILFSFAVAVLLFLSNFHLCGIFGEALRKIQLGIFGTLGFLVPILLFMGTCFHLSNLGSRTAAIKMAAAVVAILSVCGLLHLGFGMPFQETAGQPAGTAPGVWEKLVQFYQYSAEHGTGGGFLGGLVADSLSRVVEVAGACIILVVCLLISGVCITERSFVKAVKRGSDLAYQHTKENVERRRETHAEAVAKRKRLREETRVRGVNLDSTNLGETADFSQMFDEDETWPEPASAAAVRTRSTAADRQAGFGGADLKQSPVFEREISLVKDESEDTSPADIFTGNIAVPAGYENPASEPDMVPFDEDESGLAAGQTETGIFPSASMHSLAPDTSAVQTISFKEPEEKLSTYIEAAAPGRKDESIWAGAAGLNFDSFYIPEEPKQVVTAGGKVIDTDTEELKKKLEAKKKQIREEGNTSAAVSMEIAEKESLPPKEYQIPPTTLLKRASKAGGTFSDKAYKATAIKLQQTLRDFGVGVTVTNISCGPSVTRYELLPEQGVKVSRIVGLTDDIKLSLAAEDIRIEAPIPGKSAVGIEVPNKENNMVYLRELLEADVFKNNKSTLTFAVGKDIGGQVVAADIGKMPHLLIAGATGSGKSVCINTLIMSIIFKAKPEDVRLIMIDPKVVELSVYNGIPHLLIPVVTDPKKASGALNWAVAEMTDRYKKFAEYNVRDMKGYNAKVALAAEAAGHAGADVPSRITEREQKPKVSKLPQIVIIVDELADLMMVAPGEVEEAICRLAQLARAAGIHLVIATQRPSVNVITGLIKANVPSRIAFSVSSGVDSRTIIDMNGAEKLLGKGDMLFYPAGYPKPQRVQGAFVSDQEVQKVVEFLAAQGMAAQYNMDVENQVASGPEPGSGGGDSWDEYFVQAGKFIIEKDKASIGMLQRAFKIGFNRAARIMDQLSEAGIVGEEEGTKPRKILVSMEEFEEITASGFGE